jgi:ATP-dependent Clp protease ATP-binding subunit ClpA
VLSKNLEISLHRALNIAREYVHEYATIEHLLLALSEDPDALKVLQACHINIEQLSGKLRHFLHHELSALVSHSGAETRPTAGFQRVVHRAAVSVHAIGRREVTGANVLAEIFSEHESYAVYFLHEQNVTRHDVINAMSRLVVQQQENNSTSPPLFEPNLHRTNKEAVHDAVREVTKERYGSHDQEFSDAPPAREEQDSSTSLLAKYCINLNKMAASNAIDVVVGREEEIERTIEILSKRTKNNPLYIGEPGVGKTAIVEGLALRIVRKQVPDVLLSTVIYALDMGTLLAGTRYRGDFEERLKSLIKEIEKHPAAVLFIDEIHTIIGAGATSGGSLDASNLLKPALARGSFRCIGATTFKEFNQYFEKDQALVRRFQKLLIEAPSVEGTVKILRGLKPYYEKHHGIHYSAGAIEAAASLADRYIFDKSLPDKAIDVLDEAGARAKIKGSKGKKTVTSKDIEAIVAKIAQVPAHRLTHGESHALQHLEPNLKHLIIGQDEAISELCSSVTLARAGLRNAEKPMGCYIFSGPTGVGKTELAKQFAYLMHMELVRFDMSEYMEQHSVSKLIGTPPGYVGFEQGGLLTDAVAKMPYSVVLLDEIEKANQDIYNILLQVMDYGKLTDHNGKVVNFSNCVIILTTNIGASEISKSPLGFGNESASDKVREAVRAYFNPEFLNRLDAIIPFAALSHNTVITVVNKFIRQLEEQLADRGVTISVSAGVRDYLAGEGYNEEYGARPLERIIQEKIKKVLANEILFGKLAHGGKVSAIMKKENVIFNYG